ncbi:hypothetical protein BCV72DRAFT_304877 [Rhizopus microsporus var. microsporus]|uniref:Uncharacterized protein n=2 Tax=Rhizopus microsporus TaxID=58291 RepID=A0A2G4SP73_RHIZD|nr:uncharacterized protein RHIMIDRAFT_239391 [Rhizopus microsporus ATCC 52813]ORE07140.1 hypothetical protein BCV72DRAFT_304877 [Rhizopus microsporus var. microsporus]PHZ10563.1 hypothetical protein RHIMIDRAFT_239391 [Rhizopus microsporus ATCC 52813]
MTSGSSKKLFRQRLLKILNDASLSIKISIPESFRVSNPAKADFCSDSFTSDLNSECQRRKDAFVSYHGGTDVRRLSSAEYYGMGGTVKRQKLQQGRKKSLGIERIETNMPSPKTASIQ